MTRSARIFAGCFSGFIIVALLASCSTLAERAADAVYPDLQTYFDTEAPPTATSYPASSSISAVLGGRGEGLSCSIPPLLEWAMFDRQKDEAVISLQFRQACAYHDYCYRHGHATYGYTRADCDYSLQQIAYRTCRVISDMDPKACMSRARRVLLGVTVGGGKSFASGEASSYFEFDPMPAKADDYVIVRWVRSDDGKLIGGQKLKGQFVVMHFKRGTVLSRAANFDPAGPDTSQPGSNDPQLFPARFIPTPPLVVRSGDEDRLLAISRDNFQNTRIEVVEYWPALEGLRKNKLIKSSLYREDPDASVFWFGRERPDDLSYWSYTSGFGTANIVKPIHYRPEINDIYRTLQHTPVEGRFFDAGCLETAVLKRGGPQIGHDDDTGRSFNGIVHLTFVRPVTSPCVVHAPLTLAAAQANEPLSAVRLDSGRDVLVDIHPDGKLVKLAIFDLAKANGKIPLPAATTFLPPSMDSSWLRIPPQILLDANAKTSMIFFSQFVPSNPAAGRDRAQFTFRYFRLGGMDGSALIVMPAGDATCSIDLPAQLQALRHQQLGANIARSFRLTERNRTTIEGKIDAAIIGNLNERWANAQVIPGWFLQKSADAPESGPIDVAVFFRGYPQYSFLAGGRAGAGGDMHGLLSVAPYYVQCR